MADVAENKFDEGTKPEVKGASNLDSPKKRESTTSEALGSDGGSRAQSPSMSGNNITNNAKNETSSDFVFVPPAAGTPAAEALAANATIKVSKVSKGIKKIRGGMKGTPNIKGLNIFRRLRRKTKRQRKKNHFARNFKGKVIDGLHELYTLTAGMMLGIRGSVSYFATSSESELKLDDFSHVDKQVFPAKGCEGTRSTPPHDLVHTFKFKSYAPKVFGRIRNYFNIDVPSYMLSVCGNYNYLEFIANSKSGQFFFYSHDGKYMIKTQTKEENKFMRKILPHYYKYVTENPHTLLVKIVGMHRVKMYHLNRKVHFVIMTSVFDTPEKIHTIYDLKGSMVGRKVKDAERAANPGAVLKDANLVEDKRKIHLGPKKALFLEQIKKDAHFLALLNIMDYSLLLGIHDRKLRVPEEDVDEPDAPAPRSLTPFRKAVPGVYSSLNPIKIPSDYEAVEDLDKLSPSNGRTNRLSDGSPAKSRQSNYSVQSEFNDENDGSKSETDMSKVAKNSSRRASKRIKKENDNSTSFGVTDERIITSGNISNISTTAKVSMGKIYEQNSIIEVSKIELTDSKTDSHDPSSENAENSKRLDSEVCEDEEDCDEEDDDDYDEDDSDFSDEDYNEHAGYELKVPAVDIKAGQGTATVDDKITKIFRLPSPGINRKYSQDSPAANGPYASLTHPWTGRDDYGINCRVKNENGGYQRGDEIYYCGIIDILQQYNMSKQAEHFLKSFTNNAHQISAVNAKEYADRFVKFLDEHMV